MKLALLLLDNYPIDIEVLFSYNYSAFLFSNLSLSIFFYLDIRLCLLTHTIVHTVINITANTANNTITT